MARPRPLLVTVILPKHPIQNPFFFPYLQVCHFIQARCSVFPQLPPESRLDSVLQVPLHLKGLISNIYNLIISLQDISIETIKAEWVGELGIDISEDTWNKAIDSVNGTSCSAWLNLIQLKILYRIHYSKIKLVDLYPNIGETSDRCSADKADLTHMFWPCSKLRGFWLLVFDRLNLALTSEPNQTKIMALFGARGDHVQILRDRDQAFAFATLIARRRNTSRVEVT